MSSHSEYEEKGFVAWERNPNWLSLPSVSISDQKFVGLYAVFETPNYLALSASGDYTVDWGDGTVENFASDVVASHSYDFTNVALNNTNAPVTFDSVTNTVQRTAHGYKTGKTVSFSSIVGSVGITEDQIYYVVNATTDAYQLSATPNGSPITFTGSGTGNTLRYKQAVVTITPQAGINLTTLNLNLRHSQVNNAYCSSGWLDFTVSGPNFNTTGMTFSSFAAPNINHYYLEQVTIISLGAQTSLTYFFHNCFKLASVPYFNTANVTNFSGLFNACYSLQTPPWLNTQNATTVSNMFSNCNSITAAPSLSTPLCTQFNGMYSGCYALLEAPYLDTRSATDTSSMFSNCTSLRYVPLYDLSLVTNTSSMFNNCNSLPQVPHFNLASVTNAQGMFTNCYSLKSLPPFNTPNCTNFSGFISNAKTLQQIPVIDTHLATNLLSFANTCSSLMFLPKLTTSAATTITNFVTNCHALKEVAAINLSGITSSANMSNAFTVCRSLARIKATGIKYTFSIASDSLPQTSLDELYTNLATVTGQTITVTGNPGTATDTPGIAQGKGWTVTGT